MNERMMNPAAPHRHSSKASEVAKGPSSIQVCSNPLTDLHRNAMHIKKLNF